MRERAWWRRAAGQAEASQSRAADETAHLLFLAFASHRQSPLSKERIFVDFDYVRAAD